MVIIIFNYFHVKNTHEIFPYSLITRYTRINDRLAHMKKEHEDRVQTIRRAYQQQLADALARIGKLYAVSIQLTP